MLLSKRSFHQPLAQRDPVRPILGFLTFTLLYYVGLNLLIPLVNFLGGQMVGLTVTPLLVAALVNALTFAMFEQKSISDAGIDWESGAAKNLFIGTVLSSLAAITVILLPMAFGLVHFENIPNPDFSWRAVAFMPLLLFCGAAGEELVYRGFPLQFLINGYGRWVSVIGVGILFGLLHTANPNWTPLGIANTCGFGILFGFALLRSRDLWFPIGLHFGWNVTLPYLGTELSGLTIRVVGYKLVWQSGDLWSGGKYGIEGSAFTSLILVVLGIAIWKAPVRQCSLYLLDESPEA